MVRMARNRMEVRMLIVFTPEFLLITDLRGAWQAVERILWSGFREGALAASGFVGAKGSSNLPPRAQRRIWAGQIAALEGSAAVLLIGPSGKNLMGLNVPLFLTDAASISWR